MADDFYVINLIAKDGDTVVRDDQLPNPDWLMLTGTFDARSDIRLAWEVSNGTTVKSSGLYYVKTSPGSASYLGSRLIINALVENARGSDSEDFIQGNEVGNILYGDGFKDAVGGNDVLWGAGGNDTIFGGAGDDDVSGDDGNDRLFGGDGSDTLTGNAGVDTLEGGTGADFLYGGADIGDTLSYRGSDAGVKVSITFGSYTRAFGGHAEGDTIGGFTNVVGSDFGDTIVDTVAGNVAFGGNDNTFYGGLGNDTLDGGGGTDTLYGGDGNDRLMAGDGADVVYGGAGADRLVLDLGNDRGFGGAGIDVLYGGKGDDRLAGGAGDDILFGGDGKDICIGGAGDDVVWNSNGDGTLFGGTGDDTLRGNDGADRLFGGGGGDRFVFATGESGMGPANRDRIMDFRHAQGDQLDLQLYTGVLQYQGTNAFSGTAHEVRWTTTSQGALVLIDADGDGKADDSVFLDSVQLLRASDFLF